MNSGCSMDRFSRFLAAGLLFALPSMASAETWQVDPAHTHVGFKVRHMMVSWVRGEFGTLSGTVEYDAAKPDATRVDVTVQVASIDTRDAKRDEHLRDVDFFDGAKFPTMAFKSRRVQNARGDSFDVVGDLTIHGVTREVVLAVTGVTPAIKDPWGTTRVGGSAMARINRQDFGMTFNKTLDTGGYVVGDEVFIELEIELTRPPPK